jgi:hypothetical protein
MRTTKAIIAICFSIAWVSVAAQTKKPSATVIAKGYHCGDFSALLVGHVAATDVRGSSFYGKPDGVLFVFRHGNLLRQARNYTLAQVSSNIAAIAKVDFMWQCTEASAAEGCNLAAKMIVNGSNTPGSLSLQTSDGHAVECVETEPTETVTEQSANVRADSLHLVRDALTNAADKLLKSENQSDYVQDAIAVIDRALGDVDQAAAHVHDDSGAAPPSEAPNFNAAAPPSPRINFMLYSSLNSLKTACDALNRVPGGDFAGYRVRINDDIAAAAEVLVDGIASFNAKHSL